MPSNTPEMRDEELIQLETAHEELKQLTKNYLNKLLGEFTRTVWSRSEKCVDEINQIDKSKIDFLCNYPTKGTPVDKKYLASCETKYEKIKYIFGLDRGKTNYLVREVFNSDAILDRNGLFDDIFNRIDSKSKLKEKIIIAAKSLNQLSCSPLYPPEDTRSDLGPLSRLLGVVDREETLTLGLGKENPTPEEIEQYKKTLREEIESYSNVLTSSAESLKKHRSGDWNSFYYAVSAILLPLTAIRCISKKISHGFFDIRMTDGEMMLKKAQKICDEIKYPNEFGQNKS